ncbi:ATP-NAD kinase-like domain-containing protein [Mycotypha africana]|uniref:ATP-NAD kinase-like domain-containing protein n=1 Tax=Mycotypha africana TaxID=64632 RepID=UPI0023010EA9|nr:ATP-NAD kinase-like domain-containing protein [Mycotypha africana]KAI8981814.1 ATP-NAD kinase-like domain-containing protein [Mycotypha africana]
MSNPIKVKDTEGNDVQLSLSETQLTIDNLATLEKQLLLFDTIYAVNHDKSNATLVIHVALKDENTLVEKDKENTLQKRKTLTNIRPADVRWHLNQYTFHFRQSSNKKEESNDKYENSSTNSLKESIFIEQLCQSTVPHQSKSSSTKVYVFLNPTSGEQQSGAYWKDIVKPMLLNAGFQELNIAKINTERNGKTRVLAENLGRRIQLNEDGDLLDPIIISMGGDGTLHEIMNGLADAISDGMSGGVVTQQKQHRCFRVGVIPTGSGNAFALGLNLQSVEHAAAKIIKGLEEKPFSFMDVKLGHVEHPEREDWHNQSISYDNKGKPIRLLVVMSWGFHAQIVSKSRYLRYFMGNKRFSLVAMFLLLFLQQYEGELVLNNFKKYNPDTDMFVSTNDGDQLILSSNDQEQKKFTYFVVSKQHSLEKGFRIAPFASPLTDDLDIVLMRNANADALTKASMAAFQGGEHVKSSDVEYYKAKELLLRVKEKAELCLDGEVISLPAKGILNVKVVTTDPSSFTIFV